MDCLDGELLRKTTDGDRYGVWGHASTTATYRFNAFPFNGIFFHGGQLEDGSVDNTLRFLYGAWPHLVVWGLWVFVKRPQANKPNAPR